MKSVGTRRRLIAAFRAYRAPAAAVAGAPNPVCVSSWVPSELDLRRFILIVLRPKISEGSMIEALAPTANWRVLFWESAGGLRVTAQHP